MLNERKVAAYLAILDEELILATGCTEPIAVAYCAAKLREVLGVKPEKVLAEVSGNILKNVKSVVVPNTGGRRGIDAAVAVGIVAGDAQAELQVIANVTEKDEEAIQNYLDSTEITITCPETPCMLDIRLTGWAEGHQAMVRVANNHTNIITIEKDGVTLLDKPHTASAEDSLQDKSVLNVEDILTFIETVPIEKIRPLISRQIEKNTAIAAEGLKNSWGANIGSNLLLSGGGTETECRAWAAAGSDARMNGCEMPVVICSGSGNQGITASVPVWRYGKLNGMDDEKIMRAVCLSDLVTIHQKTGIGRLSAYCGAVSAGVGAGCGIAWLRGADYDGISHTIMNAVAMISGCICDGAKASCASKIAMGVETGILGYNMYLKGDNFRPGDGIVGDGVEDTIKNVGVLAAQGMRETDRVILKIMTE
ncbi:MAG: L-serine ammonia-lyase, iron-sulfur-dependent, subunit alpha [Eubacteriales bacterium]|nr:L-serine ammonia-lyase, iron-sulfur-dependent, subunit alpha [Eubacteriales bacterium]